MELCLWVCKCWQAHRLCVCDIFPILCIFMPVWLVSVLSIPFLCWACRELSLFQWYWLTLGCPLLPWCKESCLFACQSYWRPLSKTSYLQLWGREARGSEVQNHPKASLDNMILYSLKNKRNSSYLIYWLVVVSFFYSAPWFLFFIIFLLLACLLSCRLFQQSNAVQETPSEQGPL